ncbi:MAG: TonB-dependent receptor [Candidatus Binatia bacterium]
MVVGGTVIVRAVLTVVLGLMTSSGGWAQTSTGKKDAGRGAEVEEMTVTARKRQENVQEIPVSVSAIGSTAIEEKGLTNVVSLTETVPNLHVQTSSQGNSGLVIAMRGTSQSNPNLGPNPTVGLYVDGVYIAKIQAANLDLDDLERVEVLRGPQGTLFGRNTAGGAVALITRKPTEARAITAGTEVGNYDAFKGRVTLNVPLIGKQGAVRSDAVGTLSFRETAVYRSHDGYMRNTGTGGAKLKDLSRVSNMTALRWVPRRDLTLDYTFAYHRFREAPYETLVTYVYPGSPVSGGNQTLDLRPYIRKNRVDTMAINAVVLNDGALTRSKDDGNERMHSITGEWDVRELGPFGRAILKSISAYRAWNLDQAGDYDGSPLPVYSISNYQNLEHWSEELQWLGSAPRVQCVLGFYYYGEHSTKRGQQVTFSGNTYHLNTAKNSSYAPFGQLTWTPPIMDDRLSLTAGLRYTRENLHTRRTFRDLRNGANSFDLSSGRGFGGADALTPLVDMAYQWTDKMMSYVRVSKGYQSGVINASAGSPGAFTATKPETIWSYEAGVKSQWWEDRLRFNADVFYSDYSDQQVSTFRANPAGGVSSTIENAGKSRYYGGEVEVAAIPLRGVTLSGNYSYLKARYTQFLSQRIDPMTGKPVLDENGKPVVDDVSNQQRVNYAPEHSVSVGLTYTAAPCRRGTLSAHVDTFWQESMYLGGQSPFASAVLGAWSYALVNGRVQFADIPLQEGHLDVAVFGRNLFDRKYRIDGKDFGAGLGYMVNTYGDPRTFGLGVTYRFAAS